MVNQYIYRDGVENDDLALQAAVQYAPNHGVAVGGWGSTLGHDPFADSKNIPNTVVTTSLDDVVGGKGHFDTNFDDQVVLGLNFNF